jgi:hypothetical protein
MLTQSTLSQYSLGAPGSSACTAIAIHAAAALLPLLDAGAPAAAPTLDGVVRAGVEVAAAGGGGHLDFSAAWVLSPELVSLLLPLNVGAEAQGLLTTPGSLEELCAAARSQAREARPRSHVAVVLTKPPETVCLCLPPEGVEDGRFLLFDSHPRPDAPHAYAFEAASLGELLGRVRELFQPLPPEGEDEDAIMAVAMYNMFEGTFLVAKGAEPGGATPGSGGGGGGGAVNAGGDGSGDKEGGGDGSPTSSAAISPQTSPRDEH